MGSIFNPIGSILDNVIGIDMPSASYDARVTADEARRAQAGQIARQNQASDRAMQLMENFLNESQGYRSDAYNRYSAVGNNGTSDQGGANDAISTLIGQYANTAGLPSGNYTPFAAPRTATAVAPAGGNDRTTARLPGVNRGSPGSAANTLNTAGGAGAAPVNPNAPLGADAMGPFGPGGAPATVGQYLGAAGQGAATSGQDAYGLTEAQQVQLNGQVERLNESRQAQIEQLQSSYAQRGITDPRAMAAGLERINSHYDALAEQQKAGFAEEARKTRQQAEAALLDFVANIRNQGIQQQLAGAGGIANLGESTQAGGLNAMGQGMGALNSAGSMASNAYDRALQQAQYMQSRDDSLEGALLQLAGFAAGGGFGDWFGGGEDTGDSTGRRTTSQTQVYQGYNPFAPGSSLLPAGY